MTILSSTWKCRSSEARADYYRLHNTINKKLDDLTLENQDLISKNQNLTSELRNLTSENQNLNFKIQEKDVLIAQLKAPLSGKQPPV